MSRTRANIIVSDNNTVYFWTSFKKTKNFKDKKFTINCTHRKDACQLENHLNFSRFNFYCKSAKKKQIGGKKTLIPKQINILILIPL
jgi:predicted component of type VI protein secretion system